MAFNFKYEKVAQVMYNYLRAKLETPTTQKVAILTHEIDNDGIGSLAIMDSLFTSAGISTTLGVYDHGMEKDYKGGMSSKFVEMIAKLLDDVDVDLIVVTDLDMKADMVKYLLENTMSMKPIIWIDHHNGTKSITHSPQDTLTRLQNKGIFVAGAFEKYESAIKMCHHIVYIISGALTFAQRHNNSGENKFNMEYSNMYKKMSSIVDRLSGYDTGNFEEENVTVNDLFNCYREHLKNTTKEEDLLTTLSSCIIGALYDVTSIRFPAVMDETIRLSKLRRTIKEESSGLVGSCELTNGSNINYITLDVSKYGEIAYRLLSVVAQWILKENSSIDVVHWYDGKAHSFRSFNNDYAFQIATMNGGGGHAEASGAPEFKR